MIATGTDVKPLECLLFMRDVKSRNYFEQMKGRGTRVIDPRRPAKGHALRQHRQRPFCHRRCRRRHQKSLKTDSRPLEKKPGVPLKDLLAAVAVGARDEDLFTTLAGRLTRLAKIMNEKEARQFQEKAKGKAIAEVVKNLLHAYDPDRIELAAREQFKLEEDDTPTQKQLDDAKDKLITKAASPFTGDLNTFIENCRKVHEQIIDIINPDTVEFAGWDGQARGQASQAAQDFQA